MEKSIDFISSFQLESHGIASPERQQHRGECADVALKFHLILGVLFMIVHVRVNYNPHYAAESRLRSGTRHSPISLSSPTLLGPRPCGSQRLLPILQLQSKLSLTQKPKYYSRRNAQQELSDKHETGRAPEALPYSTEDN